MTPFGFGAKDQFGLGVAQNVTNNAAYVSHSTRFSKTIAKAYYNKILFKWL